ncbi:MAG: hypothetical protein JWM56_284, partial [Candidatus Peribacteria bacterium]|nr:hypothetical protein [Candidatus Peribacteria bacterium]
MPNEAAHDMLAPALSLGPVALNVQNLERMKEFYTSVIGLEVLTESNDIVLLGQKKTAIIELHKRPDLPRSIPGDAGLYHHAIVFSSRSLLAQAVERVLHYVPHLFAGSADHLVSEAFYLSDPEGNGMELYYDRDPATWTWVNGEVKMATLYLSPDVYINLHAPKKDTVTMHIFHVHLKIGYLEQAQKFYIDTIG